MFLNFTGKTPKKVHELESLSKEVMKIESMNISVLSQPRLAATTFVVLNFSLVYYLLFGFEK